MTRSSELKTQKSLPVRICALILECDEEKTVGEIVRKAKGYVDITFMVDNGSTDNTAEVARQNGAQVIQCNAKRGYGAAQYVGHMVAIQEGFHYVLQLDADGQHDPKYIPRLLETIQNDNYDIVLGSRFLSDGYRNLSFTRKIGIMFFSKAVSFLGHAKITDVTSGFKVYKVSSLKKLSKSSEKHPALEQMMEIAKRGMKIGEVPVEMPARNTGKSHLNLIKLALYPFRGIWAIFKVWLLR